MADGAGTAPQRDAPAPRDAAVGRQIRHLLDPPDKRPPRPNAGGRLSYLTLDVYDNSTTLGKASAEAPG